MQLSIDEGMPEYTRNAAFADQLKQWGEPTAGLAPYTVD
jgi:hypothetical protein